MDSIEEIEIACGCGFGFACVEALPVLTPDQGRFYPCRVQGMGCEKWEPRFLFVGISSISNSGSKYASAYHYRISAL